MKGFGWILSLALLMVMAPAMAPAYDKPKHEPITEMAAEVYNVYAKDHGLQVLDASAILAIVRGSVSEDHANIFHPCETIRRLKNWHFYDPYPTGEHRIKPEEDKLLGHVERSLHARFNSLATNLDSEITTAGKNRRHAYNILGRILHYIEDMGVPAHVAPIYHVKPETGYGWIMKLAGEKTIPDGFDAYAPANPVRTEALIADKAFMDKISSVPPNSGGGFESTLNAFLKGLAEDTRRKVASDPRWLNLWTLKGEDNWGEKSEQEGFVEYGRPGSLGFSTETGVCNDTGITREACDSFYRNRLRAVVKTSVQLLAYVQGKFAQKLSGK
ncbi:MAG TPA: hypothetical protein VKA31_00570 [Mariprofundaceae bacterium]|nr:hypothetical protein [Mariprofundaceae bacterium]